MPGPQGPHKILVIGEPGIGANPTLLLLLSSLSFNDFNRWKMTNPFIPHLFPCGIKAKHRSFEDMSITFSIRITQQRLGVRGSYLSRKTGLGARAHVIFYAH